MPAWTWVEDELPGDGVANLPNPTGSLAAMYFVIGYWGYNNRRIARWTPDGQIITVDPYAEWGRAVGPMCRLTDGRLFIYDAALGPITSGTISLGYFLDADLANYDPFAAYPVGSSSFMDDVISGYGSVHYREESDRLIVSDRLAHNAPDRRYEYAVHELTPTGVELKHDGDFLNYGTNLPNSDVSCEIDGKIYWGDSGDVYEYDPSTGACRWTSISGAAPTPASGNFLPVSWSGRLVFDAFDGTSSFFSTCYPDDLEWNEGIIHPPGWDYVIGYTGFPYEAVPYTSYGPDDAPGLAYSSMDMASIGDVIYYGTTSSAYGSGDADPSGYAIIGFDMVTQVWEPVVELPNVIDPATGFGPNNITSVIAVAQQATEISGGWVAEGRHFS